MLKRCFVFQSLQERKQRKALAEAAALFQLIQIDLKIRIRKMLLFFFFLLFRVIYNFHNGKDNRIK